MTIHPGPNAESAGIAAIAIVVVIAAVLLLGGGRFPWDGPTASPAQAGGLASASPEVTPNPSPTPSSSTATTAPSETPPPVTPPPTPPTASPLHIAVEVVDRTGTNSRGIIDGVRLAVKDAGGKVNGVAVTVPDSVVYDDNGNTSTGKDAIAKIVKDQDVVAVVGPYNSTVAAAQMPSSNKAGLLQCSPSATSEGLTRPEAGAARLRRAARTPSTSPGRSRRTRSTRSVPRCSCSTAWARRPST